MHNIMTTDEAVNLLSFSTFCNNYKMALVSLKIC